MTELLEKNNPSYPFWRYGFLMFFCLAVLDFISCLSWLEPFLGNIITIILVLGWLILATKNLLLAVIFLLAELIIGSFGYILSFNLGNLELSLRLGLFLVAFAIMIYRIIGNRRHIIFSHSWRWYFTGSIFALLWAAGRGYYNWNNLANLFLDMNGYLYILLLPLFLEAYNEAGNKKLMRYVKMILVPTVIWLSARTVILLYLFTHIENESLILIYKWYRDSGLGEITSASGGFWRVFSQSHIYLSLASVSGAAWLWHRLINSQKIKFSDPGLIFIFIVFIGLVASLSRSLWLGAVVAILLIPLVSLNRSNFKKIGRYLIFIILLVMASVGGVLVVSRIVWPLKPLGDISAQAFANRFRVESAGQARLNLWPPLWQAAVNQPVLGSGFGSTVAYFSTDPRAVKSTAGGTGLVVTYAFEWGWLDFWYKFGVVGLLFFTAWLIFPVWRGLILWRSGNWVGFSAFALVALYLTHFTTPYLNHPLGLGAVLALGTIALSSKAKD